MALGLSLLGMDKADISAKSVLKNLDKLGGEGDFGDEKNGGFLGL